IRAVEIPAIRGTARATARLMVRHVRARARVVRLLRLPRDDPALDVDLPATGAGAVHAVRGADDLVVLPALPVCVLPASVLAADLAVPLREGLPSLRKESETVEKMAHEDLPDPTAAVLPRSMNS